MSRIFTAREKVLMQLVSGPKTYGDLKSVTRNPKHLSNILPQLEKEGLITWDLAPNDRRVKIYRITEKGKKMIQREKERRLSEYFEELKRRGRGHGKE